MSPVYVALVLQPAYRPFHDDHFNGTVRVLANVVEMVRI